VQEDVDLIGLSVLSGAHMTLFKRVLELLKDKGADDVMVIGGGIIPEASFLKKMFRDSRSLESKRYFCLAPLSIL